MVDTKRILVAGSSGMIGSHLVDELIENDYEVYGFDAHLPGFGNKYLNPKAHSIVGDVRRYEDVDFATKNIDVIVHLAAISHVKTCLENPKLCMDVNCGGTINILEAARKNNIKRVIIASSDHIFGKSPHLPASENNRLNSLLESDPYGKSKAIQYIFAKMYFEQYGLPVVTTASGNVYSSRQSKPNMIPNFIDNALHNEPLYVHGNGNQTRDLYHVDDLIQGYIKCIETKNIDGELFNFGSSHEISVTEIANKILELIPESKSKIIHTKDTTLNAMNRMLLYINKAKLWLDWEPKIDLDDGLKRTIEEWRLK